jgi:carboxylesterase type B
LFFIYGGNLQTGNGDRLAYDASRLAAEHNIVAVVINYRVSGKLLTE